MPRVEYKMLLEHSLASVAHYVYDEEFGDGQTIASFMESREHFAVKAVDVRAPTVVKGSILIRFRFSAQFRVSFSSF